MLQHLCSPDNGDGMGEQTPRLALLRLSGEIGIKARATRHPVPQAARREPARRARELGLPPQLEISHDRLYAALPAHTALEDHALARVFGVSSLSLVERHPITALPDIVRMGERCSRTRCAAALRGARAARRPARGRDRERERGRAPARRGAAAARGRRRPENPEVTVRLELTERATVVLHRARAGPGRPAARRRGARVALLSGGFDSAVATWQIQKRGVECDLVFCNLGGAAHLREVLRVAVHLATRWSYGSRPRLFAIDFEPVADALRAYTTKRYWQILLKRQMLRAAEAVATRSAPRRSSRATAVGQVSSQTLPNLAVVSRATPLAVLRPLVGFDKSEIIDRARAIGTYALSESVGEYCALVPNKPATQARLDAVLAEEARLPDDPLRASARGARTCSTCARSTSARSTTPSSRSRRCRTTRCCSTCARSRSTARAHHPAALHLDFAQRARGVAELRPRTPLRAWCASTGCSRPARRSHAARRIPRAPFPRRPARAHARGRARHSGERMKRRLACDRDRVCVRVGVRFGECAAPRGRAGRRGPRLVSGLAPHHHPIATESAEAQAFFDQGFAWVFAFNHDEATRSFERAAQLDPKSPMPQWGIAWSVGPNYNLDIDDPRAVQASQAIAKAQELAASAPPDERAYVEAMAVRYSPDPKADRKKLARKYATAMRELSRAIPTISTPRRSTPRAS
jgi:thiamine biosynthesis protein ThiI